MNTYITQEQKEITLNGKKYNLQTDRYGKQFVLIDGKRVDVKKPIFDSSELIQKKTEQLNEAKEKASFWANLFDINLENVRKNRRERLAFTKEYGNYISAMSEEHQAEYKALLAEGSEYSSNKNIALGRQLSYTNDVISLACSKRNLINQASIFS